MSTDLFVDHQFVINRLICSLKYQAIPVPGVTFMTWKSFEKPFTAELRLIPDGYLELATPTGTLAAFLEIDLGTESQKVWREKANRYLELALSGEFERRFGKRQFRVLVIAHSERRLRSIRSVIASLTEKLFWFATQHEIETHGFFGPIWLRPKSDAKEGLIHTP